MALGMSEKLAEPSMSPCEMGQEDHAAEQLKEKYDIPLEVVGAPSSDA